MTYEKRESLIPLLESENQTHLTIYLENRGDIADLKRQINSVWIYPPAADRALALAAADPMIAIV